MLCFTSIHHPPSRSQSIGGTRPGAVRRHVGLGLIACLALVFLTTGLAWAADVTLAWDANDPAPEGYHLFMRLDGETYNYNQPAWTGAGTTCTITDVPDGTTCFFVVRAFNGTDESGDSNEVSFSTAASNTAPTANAGQNQSVQSGALVTLNGSGSQDSDGDTLAYSWRQISGPTVAMAGNLSARPTFTAPAASTNTLTLVFELTVTDSQDATATDTCTVTVQPAGPADSDGDGVSDASDAFPSNPAEWLDSDGDGLGNNADHDDDNDGVTDSQDAFPYNGSEWIDSDQDGQGDNADVDDDNDGVADAQDAFPYNSAEWLDSDGDGQGDHADLDDDNDGMTDTWEIAHSLDPLTNDAGLDSDGDGLSNYQEYVSNSDPHASEVNQAPDRPEAILGEDSPAAASLTPWLYSSVFSDPDSGNSHSQTQWRIRQVDSQREVFNQTSTNRFLTKLHVPRLVLDPQTEYVCELRHFDQDNIPSVWSPPVYFTTIGLGDDKNNNGVKDSSEPIVYSDFNNDGVDDSQQLALLRSVQNPTTFQVAAVSIEESTDVEAIDYGFALDPDMLDPEMDSVETSAYGIIGYRLRMAGLGQSTDVILYFEQAIDPASAWACLNGDLESQDCSDEVDWVDEGHMAIRSLTDGGQGDADGAVNGVIVDFIAPATAAAVRSPSTGLGDPQVSDTSSAAVEGGCFIGSLLN